MRETTTGWCVLTRMTVKDPGPSWRGQGALLPWVAGEGIAPGRVRALREEGQLDDPPATLGALWAWGSVPM